MKNRQAVEQEVLEVVAKVVPRVVQRSAIRPEADLKSELGIDSLGLFSLVDLLDQKLGTDLLSQAARLAEARLVSDFVDISFEAYSSREAG